MVLKRDKYLKKIRPFFNKKLIKVLTGQRRVGKSYMLQQIRDELLVINPDANVIYIDMEKLEFDHLLTYKELAVHIKENSSKGMNYLMIDEIQEIDEFEKALRSYLREDNFDIYCTGSNSKIFSGELATYLSGRQIEVKIHSLSFPEFLTFHDLEKSQESLNRFLKYGGLPYLKHLPDDEEVIFDYLKNIYSTILYRDIIRRNKIRDVVFLEKLILYLADNLGSLVSATKISDYHKSLNNNKSVSVIINYLKYVEYAYFAIPVQRMEIKGKKIFESGEKYYFEDIGLRNSMIGFRPDDIANILENVVHNHLRYLNYDLFVGRDGDKEIDFVAEKRGERVYFQVCYLLSSDKVMGREFGNLLHIKDNYPKYVISMDQIPDTTSYHGIKRLNLLDFLCMETF